MPGSVNAAVNDTVVFSFAARHVWSLIVRPEHMLTKVAIIGRH